MIKEIVLIVACVAVADAVVCSLFTCLSFQCGSTTCPPGYRVKVGGGFCGCCNNCVQALKEGETCKPVIQYGGYPVHKGVTNSDPMCDYGHKCDSSTETCVKAHSNSSTAATISNSSSGTTVASNTSSNSTEAAA